MNLSLEHCCKGRKFGHQGLIEIKPVTQDLNGDAKIILRDEFLNSFLL